MSFDPPAPPRQSVRELVRIAVLAFALLPIAVIVYAPLHLLGLVTAFRRGPVREGRPVRIPDDLAQTTRPRVSGDGLVACNGCGATVPFASMSIDERGYFCARCARTM